MNFIKELRERFTFLSFLTDKEIVNLLSVVGSVSQGTSVTPEEILQKMDVESKAKLAHC